MAGRERQHPGASRRWFIKASACGTFYAAWRQATAFGSGVLAPAAEGREPAFVSGVLDRRIAAVSPGEGFGAAAFTSGGSLLWQAQLPARSHGQTIHPSRNELCVFARRPGDYFAILAAGSGKIMQMVAPPKGRVFQGHGCYSPDGAWLYTSENAFDEGHGVIGIYTTRSQSRSGRYQRIGEWHSGGVGAHEILWLGDDLIAVANGGIKTHPDFPRQKLNLKTMRSEVTLITASTGRVVARYKLPESAVHQQLSLRHMAIHPRGTHLAVAAQHQQKHATVPLLYTIELPKAGQANPSNPKAKPRLVAHSLPDSLQTQMRGYCGSVAYSPCGTWLYGSSPKGGLMVAIPSQPAAAASPSSMPLPDGCGIASTPAGSCGTKGHTVFTSGSGVILASAPSSAEPFPMPGSKKSPKKNLNTKEDAIKRLPLHFDNHSVFLS